MSMCNKCRGGAHLVFGALLLLNSFVWPLWLGIDGWVSFIAVLMVLGGFLKMVVPNCCSKCKEMSAPVAEKPKSTRRKRRK